MTTIDGKSYKVVQLDTNALSNVVKAKDDFLKILMDRYLFGQYFFCYSPFSVLEIKKSDFLYKRFCELFSIVPSFLLKGYHHLWNEEVAGYGRKINIDCTHFCIHTIKTNGELLNERHVDSLFNHPNLVKAFHEWEIDKHNWFDKKLEARQSLGFDLKYDSKKISDFMKKDTFDQIKTCSPSFINQNKHTTTSLIFDGLWSFKMMSYMTYHKFHADKRNPVISDIYDIFIVATAPYVDALITEGQMADSLKKIKKVDNFIKNLEIKSLKDI